MSTLASLRPLVLGHVPAASNFLVDRTMVEAARIFCRESLAWRRAITETVTAGTLEVIVSPPAFAELVDVISGVLDDTIPLTKSTPKKMDREYLDWRTDQQTPEHVLMGEAVNEILIAPLSSTTYTAGLQLFAAFKPILTATTLDDLLVSEHIEAIVHGALSKLFLIPGRPWTDGTLAAYYQNMFDQEIMDAKSHADSGRTVGVPRKVRYGGI